MVTKKRPRGRAATADRHSLYELSVQDPPSEVEFTTSTFQKLRRRRASSLREDFCGSAVFSLAWVQSHPERTAVGVDLDRDTLDWGLTKRIRPAGGDFESRITLRNANVMEPSPPLVDVAVAFNFSYWCFETRAILRRYFEAARAGLVADGVFFLDAYGGTEVPRHELNEREIEDEDGTANGGQSFTYVWEQVDFNPITAHMNCAIHFKFRDRSRIDSAFTYSWRVWTLPELIELLHEAGFVKVRVWTEVEDASGDGTGRHHEATEAKHLSNEGVWWVYISAENG
jgi:hypothetical protein